MALVIINLLNLLLLTLLFIKASRKEFTAFSYYYLLITLYYVMPVLYFSVKDFLGIQFSSRYFGVIDHYSWILASISVFIYVVITLIIQNLKVIDVLSNKAVDAFTMISFPRWIIVASILSLSLIVLASAFIYAQAFGGFSEMYASSALVRSSQGKDIALNPDLLIFSRFAYMAIIPFALLYAIRSKDKGSRVLDKIMLFFAFAMITQHIAMSIFGSLSKQAALDSLIIILIGYGYIKSKNISSLVVVAFLAGIFLVPFIEPFTEYSWIVNKQYEVLYDTDSVILNFTHPFASLALILNGNDDLYSLQLFFNDYVGGLGGNLIPVSWVENLQRYDSIYVNSYLRFSNQELSIPPGGIAASLSYFGFISFLIFTIIFGLFVKNIDVLRSRSLLSNRQNAILAAVLITFVNSIVYHGLPRYYLYTPIVLITIFMTLLLTAKK